MNEGPPADAWIDMISREDLAGQTAAAPAGRSLYDFGFVANMARLMRTHPGIAATWGPHFRAIMGEGGALSRQEKEMVAAVAAAAQDCHY